MIHTGCLHSPTYDDVIPEDVNANPDPHHYPHHQQGSYAGRAGHHRGQKCGGRSGGGDHNGNQQNLIDASPEDKDNNKEKHMGAMVSLFSLNNCTLHCDECHGESYWVSFHEKSFYRGQHFKLYRGIINGKGPQRGEKCVVKVFSNIHGTEELCKAETRKSEKFRQLVREFNQRVAKDSPYRLRATRSYWAQMDEVSKLKQLFFSGDKRLSSGEAVLFEQDVRVSDFSTKKCKVMSYVDQKGRWFNGAYSALINAFVHFTHEHSNGELVVCELNGVKDDAGHFFSTPTIHSTTRTYGNTDGGDRGIYDVMSNHTCGQLCHAIMNDPRSSVPVSVPVPVSPRVVFEEKGGLLDDVMSSPSIAPEDAVDCKTAATGPRYVDAIPSDGFQQDLAPSAPSTEEEMNGNEMPPPPPYTPFSMEQKANVALWLIEESRNFSPNIFLPRGPVSLGSSIACHSAHTGHLATESTADMESTPPSIVTQTRDVNANFTCHNVNKPRSETVVDEPRSETVTNELRSETVTNEPLSETATNYEPRSETATNYEPRSETLTNEPRSQTRAATSASDVPMSSSLRQGCTQSDKTGGPQTTAQCDAASADPRVEDKSKRVRFLDQESSFEEPAPNRRRRSPSAPSVSACLSDDVTMDTCTNASVSSSPSLPARSRRRSSGSVSTDNRDSAANELLAHHRPPSVAGQYGGFGGRPFDFPPPYTERDPDPASTDSTMDIATANWVLSPDGPHMHSYGPPMALIRTMSENGNSVLIRAHAINYSHINNNNISNINSNNNNIINNNINNNGGVYISVSPNEHPSVFNSHPSRFA